MLRPNIDPNSLESDICLQPCDVQAEHLTEMEEKLARQRILDAVEEALMESFPASDPPSSTTTHI